MMLPQIFDSSIKETREFPLLYPAEISHTAAARTGQGYFERSPQKPDLRQRRTGLTDSKVSASYY